MYQIATAALLMSVGASAQCLGGRPTNPLPAGRHTLQMTYANVRREFLVDVPAVYDGSSATPVVMSFHGFSNNANIQCNFGGTARLSEELGFVGVCPQGTGFPLSWNGGECCGPQNRDDVGFARAMIKELSDRVCVDEKSVYSMGFSNGGYLSYRLACEASDFVAGIMNLAGLLSGPFSFPCNPEFRVPVYHVHGTRDNTINFGRAVAGYERYTEDVHQCSAAETVTYQAGSVTCSKKDSCPDDMAAEFCSIQNGGHDNPPRADIDPLRRAWAFWAQNKKVNNTDFVAAKQF